ncbi:MAG: CobW family GTP-binding protein [Rhodospirillaceae bacterium]
MDTRIPVSILTGCLGSGKTTLLNRLLAERAMSDTAVIINEFGEIGLDHLLVTTPAETTVLLEDGCICCTVRGDLVQTLVDLHRRRAAGGLPPFQRVVIETTGLADPVPIIQTVATDEQAGAVYRLDAVITLIDAVHGSHQIDTQEEALKQLGVADRIVLTKTDIAQASAIAALRQRIAAINPGATVATAVHGRIPASELFGAALDGSAYDVERIAQWLRHDAYSEGRHTHHRDIHAFAAVYEEPISGSGLATWLTMLASLRGPQLLRCKGLLNVEGQPVAVHAVQTVIHEPVTLERWPDDDRRSRLVFITRGLERAAVERTFEAFRLAIPHNATAPRTIDPAAYSQFLNAARRFR